MGCVAGVTEEGNGEDVDTGGWRSERSKVRVVCVSHVSDDPVEHNWLVLSGVQNVRRQGCKECYRCFSHCLADPLLICNRKYEQTQRFNLNVYLLYVFAGLFFHALSRSGRRKKT